LTGNDYSPKKIFRASSLTFAEVGNAILGLPARAAAARLDLEQFTPACSSAKLEDWSS